MNMLTIVAITWIGKEYRFLGLDWSYIMVLGFIGNALFSMRFLVQFRRDPVGILAYLPNSLIYIRNLMLIRKRKFAFTAAAPSQHPRETD